MRKYKKALKEIRDHLSYISGLSLDMMWMKHQLEEAMSRIGQVVKKHELDKEVLQIRSWLGDVEAKVSNQWYTHTGLYEKVRREIADQITQNMNGILELKEMMENERLANR